MMQLTLLEVVQQYLDATSGFYVDSIFDNDEAQQVANIAERIYYEMVQEFPNLLFVQKDVTLDAVSDVTKPNFLLIPSAVQNIKDSELFYNVSETGDLQYKALKYCAPLEFMSITAQYSSKDTSVDVITGFDNQKLPVINDEWPTYFTSFDGKYIVTNAYNSEYDTTMQASKTRVLVTQMPVFLRQDAFLIPIPQHLSTTYLAMVLSECFNLVYQQPNAMLNQKARKLRIKMQQASQVLGSGGRAKQSYGKRNAVSRKSRR
jgi:archaellum component FlaF (FlaF/FlaG flagellin family)